MALAVLSLYGRRTSQVLSSPFGRMEEEEGRKETCATEGASERGFPTRTRIALAGPIQDGRHPLASQSLQAGRKEMGVCEASKGEGWLPHCRTA